MLGTAGGDFDSPCLMAPWAPLLPLFLHYTVTLCTTEAFYLAALYEGVGRHRDCTFIKHLQANPGIGPEGIGVICFWRNGGESLRKIASQILRTTLSQAL
ncbi:hypothetical protein GQ53DRAFT_749710 [Thozetella sp. PMI_491]|nr:hypothetical protein GQ53DRAFT_749710 [Thozetella sp. PMI_491]